MSEAITLQDKQTKGAAAVPKDAAAVVLVRGDVREPEVFWARRGERLAFQPGFYAVPGGQRDEADAEVEDENADASETA
ncbi:MAG TPA: hypothetical protein VF521_04995, partial [Pyrinomonadaceae bacterium]